MGSVCIIIMVGLVNILHISVPINRNEKLRGVQLFHVGQFSHCRLLEMKQ